MEFKRAMDVHYMTDSCRSRWFELFPEDKSAEMACAWIQYLYPTEEARRNKYYWAAVLDTMDQNPKEFEKFKVLYRLGIAKYERD